MANYSLQDSEHYTEKDQQDPTIDENSELTKHENTELTLYENTDMAIGGGSPPARMTWHLLHACCCSYLGAMSFGYMVGFSSLALTQMTKEDGLLDGVTASWFIALAPLGGALGSLLGGLGVDRLGRRTSLVLSALPCVLGWGVLAWFSSVGGLLSGRFLTGMGSGLAQVACWSYVAEISPPNLRGVLGTSVQLLLTIGVLSAFLLGLVLDWRPMAAIGCIFPVLSVVLLIPAPETPRFYLKSSRREDAMRSLRWLREPGYNVKRECDDIESVVAQTRDASWSWSDVIKPQLYRPLLICLVIKLLQQGTGIDAVKMYTVDIFQSAGFTEVHQSRLAAVAIGLTTTLATLGAAKMMDHFGRRKLLLASGAGTALTSFTLGLSLYHSPIVDTADTISAEGKHPLLALASLVIYCIFFGIGYGPVPMLVTSELLPVRGKGFATSVISVLGWLAAFLVTKGFGSMQIYLGPHGAFWTFSVLCLVGCLFVFRCLPETKGRTLEDIELFFRGRREEKQRYHLVSQHQ